uniref:Glycosyltransferase n=1 Tax=viral metagenome TaxID=1070528 RepID=A0A6H1ZC36_9ZZZZ
MNVFCDFHHGGMYHAMHLLFVDRLGCNLYRPVGYEWVERDLWHVSELKPTQAAYLNPGGEHWRGEDGIWHWRDNGAELQHDCITFEQFWDMPIDLIISTHPAHEEPYQRLLELKPGARLIRVCGNTGEVIHGKAGNVMDSTGYFRGQAENYIVFHQEFPLEPFVDMLPPQGVISQYLNFFRNHPSLAYWEKYRPELPEYQWRMYGHQGDDGFLSPLGRIAASMADTSFVWHIKTEGYGHIIHNAYAAGRPVITEIGRYRGYTAEALLEDGVTCVDISGGADAIRHHGQPDELLKMCENARERFRQVVDFDAEEQEIRAFIERLV